MGATPVKEVIPAAAASAVAAPSPDSEKAPSGKSTPPAAKRVWRFVKTQVPAEELTLPGGKKVTFRLIRTQSGGFAPVSEFATEDEAIARGLIELETKGVYYVFRVK